MVYNFVTYHRKRKPDDDPGAVVVAPKKVKKPTPWQEDWLREDDLKDWLQKHPTQEQTAICKYCMKPIKFTQKCHLIDHSKTQAHEDSIDVARATGAFVPVTVEGPSFRNRVQDLELCTAYFIAEHNVGVALVDDLIPFMRKLLLDPEAVSKMRTKEDKCGQVIKNVLFKSQFESVKETLNKTCFSVLVDETTALGNVKLMCVSVQYLDKNTGKVVQHLLKLLELPGEKGTAKDIFKKFKEFFDENETNMQNIVALGCDNASVMVGQISGFQTLLRAVVPHLILLNCVCHSSALIAKSSCKMIPKEVEDLLRSVSSYFSNSPKRFAEYKNFAIFLNSTQNKPLKLSGTRWLEACRCYARLREIWPTLLQYFSLEVFEIQVKLAAKSTHDNESQAKESNVEKIFNMLSDNANKAYAAFLEYALNVHNSFNATYQTKGLLIHEVWRSIKQILRAVGNDFLVEEAVENVVSEDFDVDANLRPLEAVYFGPNTHEILNTLPDDIAQTVRENCLNFYVKSVKEMRSRLLEHRDLLVRLIFVEPKIALNMQLRQPHTLGSILDLVELCPYFSFIQNKSMLAVEWRELPTAFEPDEIERYQNLDVESFWKIVFEMKNGAELRFPTLTKLVEAVFFLPHSNAEPERTFSDVNEIKDAKGNSTGTDLLNARCFLRSYGSAFEINSENFESKANHYHLMQNENLYISNK